MFDQLVGGVQKIHVLNRLGRPLGYSQDDIQAAGSYLGAVQRNFKGRPATLWLPGRVIDNPPPGIKPPPL